MSLNQASTRNGRSSTKEAFLLFDVLPAGHGVPHAGAREPLHVLHDDKGLLLQRDDGQVAVVQLGVAEGVEARPHWVFKRKAAVVQFPHLEATTEKEVTRRRGGVSRSRPGNVQV